MNKYVKAFLITWGAVVLTVLIASIPVGGGETRVYSIDVPSSCTETTLREQEALAKDFLEGKVTEIEDTKTFAVLEPEVCYLNIQAKEKRVKITYLGRTRTEGPAIHTLKEISWFRSYKALSAQLAGTTLTVTVRPDFGDFAGGMVLFGFVGALLGALVDLLIAMWTES